MIVYYNMNNVKIITNVARFFLFSTKHLENETNRTMCVPLRYEKYADFVVKFLIFLNGNKLTNRQQSSRDKLLCLLFIFIYKIL